MKNQHIMTLSVTIAICAASPSCKPQGVASQRSERHQTGATEVKGLKFPDSERMVRLIIAEQLGIKGSKIKNSDHVMKDLGADSLDAVELIMAVEEEFNISIADADAERLNSVADLIIYADAKRSK